MNKIAALFFACTPLLLAAQGKLNKGITRYEVYPNSAIDMNENDSFGFHAERKDSNMLVFDYFDRADEYADMTDDERISRLLFAVPAGTKSFELTPPTLRAAYLQGCFCVDRGWHLIKDGVIRGRRIDARSWEVEVNVTTEQERDRSAGPIPIELKGKFTLVVPPPKHPPVRRKAVKRTKPKAKKRI